MQEKLNELALFAGAGGGILGGKLLGWKCVCAVEYEPAARRMLAARQDDGCLDPFPIWDDVRTFDGKPWRGLVDVVSGGFPCQDISAAGKGAGLDGERSGLWSEMSRIIGEVRPRYALVENSPVLTSRGLGVVLGDLAAMGYDARWGVLGAIDAGAPHKRERIWIVGYANSFDGRPGTGRQNREEACHSGLQLADTERIGQPSESNRSIDGTPAETRKADQPRGSGEIPDAQVSGLEGHRNGAAVACARSRQGHAGSACGADGAWWESEPNVGRVAHGVASRVDRLRAIGNGQVPAVVRLAWDLLKP